MANAGVKKKKPSIPTWWSNLNLLYNMLCGYVTTASVLRAQIGIRALMEPIMFWTLGQKFISEKPWWHFIQLLEGLSLLSSGNLWKKSNKSDLCLLASKQTGSQRRSGSAKQKYIKTMEEGLKQLSWNTFVLRGKSSGRQRQYIWEMESFHRLLINKHTESQQSATRFGAFLMPTD